MGYVKSLTISLVELQAKELLKLQEFQSGDMPQALGRAFLRMDELLVEDNFLEELQTLAGPKDKRHAPSRTRMCIAGVIVPESVRKTLWKTGVIEMGLRLWTL